jgi:HemY protein
MRIALSILTLFAIAVAVALLAGNNQGTITLYWPPYRVDLSLNLVLLLVVMLFVVLHLALRALAALFAIPAEARRWRLQHKERAMHVALLDALSHLIAGRFIRSRKAAELVLVQESALARGGDTLTYGARLRALSHLLAAESAHALQNRESRDAHFQQALEQSARRDAQETRDGVQLRAARWALDDRDAPAALRWLDDMPQGAARRTVALRLRLKAARLARQTLVALETARLLAKHKAFSEAAGQTIVRGLALELLRGTHDPAQLQKVWLQLDAAERASPEIATAGALRLLVLGGDVEVSRLWLLPVWERMVQSLLPAATPGVGLTQSQRVKLIQTLERGFSVAEGAPDAAWLTRIETAQLNNPGDASLQYLAGITCMHLQLWGKAQQLLKQSLPKLRDSPLEQSAWSALAVLAEQRCDSVAATQAYRSAVLSGAPTRQTTGADDPLQSFSKS